MNGNDPHGQRWLTISERTYALLLRLYPADFRRGYGGPMRQLFRDVCRDAYRQGGASGLIVWWAAALVDLLQSVIAERRKVNSIMTRARFIHLSGWLCLFGGLIFASGGISQLQPGSHYGFYGIYHLSIYALIPGMLLLALGMVGIYLRYQREMVLFGKIALLTALIGAALTGVSWLVTLTVSDSAWAIFMVGFLVYLAGASVFGGYATTTHLLPRWNWTLLIGSALPLTLVLLSLRSTAESYGANWGAFIMIVLIGLSWIGAGLALNSRPAAQPAAA